MSRREGNEMQLSILVIQKKKGVVWPLQAIDRIFGQTPD